jgi:hypothetical protein
MRLDPSLRDLELLLHHAQPEIQRALFHGNGGYDT